MLFPAHSLKGHGLLLLHLPIDFKDVILTYNHSAQHLFLMRVLLFFVIKFLAGYIHKMKKKNSESDKLSTAKIYLY